MRIGLGLPIVTAYPPTTQEWEHGAGITEIATVARVADALGFHHVTCSEHVAVPDEVAAERGGVYWDPLATFGYLAAVTRQIRFATSVLVLGYHHPLEVAKRYGTLDQVSGGRLVLGVGVGSLEEEFELLGAEFAGRGARADDALAAIRSAFATGTPSHAGPYYAYDGVTVEPHAAQAQVPVWVGGRSRRALRRAVELGNGFSPFALTPDQVRDMLAATDLPADFDVILPSGPLDPLGDPGETRRRIDRLGDAGATIVTASIAATSVAHYVEQLTELHAIGQALGVAFTPAGELSP
ncbi:LLM class F420-dependent oxidoreductase [Gordonia sp. (in: high G+C Gram-positive bacteria)]|uniref:LLM class F420-dependent oxidoreductase n=1 Tax=Gordonia sp. (in: high G+C Gram-positive bacteria) TaxID=84139 RepID=UPI0016A5CAA0|nr:LLM class F420-dependent oxidoreductase [Gordonia sp. (in: high G+C Gram-positive bacteria)]NLG46902.1 LLM class F420-dependent oxidoreductase [Gordonia sp. (in: high G+C Gram-positive bacteria)]